MEESAASEKVRIWVSLASIMILLQPQLEESRMISADCYPISGALEALIEHTKSWNNSEMNLMWLCQRQSPSLPSFQVATYANNDDKWVPNFQSKAVSVSYSQERKPYCTARKLMSISAVIVEKTTTKYTATLLLFDPCEVARLAFKSWSEYLCYPPRWLCRNHHRLISYSQ